MQTTLVQVEFFFCGLSFPEFHSDVEIVFVSHHKGRGGVAKKNIKFGTIIMASKAAAIAFAEEKTFGMRILFIYLSK
jgi:hypothetical protein